MNSTNSSVAPTTLFVKEVTAAYTSTNGAGGDLPVPAIIFLCVIMGCMVVLVIVYQLLQRDMCCNLETGGDENTNRYKEIPQNFYDFDETDVFTTDEDPQSRKSSRRSSRRSSYELGTSQSGGELGLNDDMSTYSDQIDIRVTQEDGVRHAGRVLLDINYSIANQQMAVTVIKAADVPSKSRGGSSAIQIRLVIMPSKHQRFKTKVRPASNPVFNETFSFPYIDQLSINQSSLRLRLYGQERYNQGRLIGELIQPLRDLDLSVMKADDERQIWKPLTYRTLTTADSMYDLSDTNSTASFGSPIGSNPSLYNASSAAAAVAGCHGNTPELLISLCYVSLTGRLTVEVLKATNLRYMQMHRAPDSYVKIEVLTSRGKKVAKSKTTIRRNMTEPEFNESFIFQMSESDLLEVTIVFSVIYISKARKKNVVGWFVMGKEATGIDEIDHWQDMMEKKEQKVTSYHPLTTEN